jgi:hypothetical protein
LKASFRLETSSRFSALSTAYLQLTPATFAKRASGCLLPVATALERAFTISARGSCPLSAMPEGIQTKGTHGSNPSSEGYPPLSGLHPSHADPYGLRTTRKRSACNLGQDSGTFIPVSGPRLRGSRNFSEDRRFRGDPQELLQEMARDATSSLRPGPMVEDRATRLT